MGTTAADAPQIKVKAWRVVNRMVNKLLYID
jgi:hypothetical protein